MNTSTMTAVQKQIKHILDNRFTAREIADNYLNISFDQRTPLHPDDEAKAKKRIAENSVLSSKLNTRSEPEQLINEIVRAVGFYEPIVLSEYKNPSVLEIDKHMNNASQNIGKIAQDVDALTRTLLQPLTLITKEELTARRDYLQEVLSQGYVYISRQLLTGVQK